MLVSKILNKKVLIDYSIDSLEYNSKKINKKSVFFAIKGKNDDGNKYIDECILKGCRTIICNDLSSYNKYKSNKNINIFYFKNIYKEMAKIAKRFYKDLSTKLYLIGITGTNGKTSTSTLVYKYLRSINLKASLIGTNGVYINDEYFSENNTTPNVLDLYKYLYMTYNKGIKYVVMEVSSHAISLYRVYGIKFKIKCLTNISLDHLDFHKKFEYYKKTKENWFEKRENTIYLIRNCLSEKIKLETKVNIHKNNFKTTNWEKISVKVLNQNINGTKFEVYSEKNGSYGIYETNLIGNFNIENISMFISIIKCINKLDIYHLKKFFSHYISIDGRVNIFKEKNRYFVIDFAHTPDGILKVIYVFKNIGFDVISVCGCGGDRDKSKRSIIGKILSDNSKYSIFTSDNPRSENSIDIIKEMKKDIFNNNVFVEVDRLDAIKKAYELSNEEDVILILGKGNEREQIFKDKIIKISDYDLLEKVIGD